MTVAVIIMLAATAAGGYYAGYRAGARKPTWQQRLRRPALARQTVSLVALLAVSQLQRSVRRRFTLPPMRALRR